MFACGMRACVFLPSFVLLSLGCCHFRRSPCAALRYSHWSSPLSIIRVLPLIPPHPPINSLLQSCLPQSCLSSQFKISPFRSCRSLPFPHLCCVFGQMLGCVCYLRELCGLKFRPPCFASETSVR
ncbi:hypothetical protein ANANG_G00193870 [Anguilla anguilla]|uniref:Secreted protein n=1 Tax=Anguilla anguilla TaxID=7936 RepID=A0A9D3RRR8_ANGAN|nr:hypothetical protein ANANG_G00193870 [Anguilla anguilla]